MLSRSHAAAIAATVLIVMGAAHAQDWPRIDRPADGVTLVYDDYGAWGGSSMGTSHQVRPDYRVRKHLDLSVVPQRVFDRAKEARVLVYLAVQDYSWNMPEVEHNGLDESFEIVVNGNVHRFRTADVAGARATADEALQWGWRQFDVPLRHLNRDENVIEIRKSDRDEPPYDDYIYVGIDNTESRGHSAYRDGEQDWTDGQLNAIGATGEYMVRVLLLASETRTTTTWQPGQGAVPPIGYVDATSAPRNRMIRLREADYVKFEFDPHGFDPTRSMTITVESIGSAPRIVVSDRDGRVIGLPITPVGRSFRLEVPPDTRPAVLYIGAAEAADSFVQSVTFEHSVGHLLEPPPVNMSPAVSRPSGGRVGRTTRCDITDGQILMQDGLMQCSFATQPALQMTSFHNQWIDAEMLREPDRTHLFLVEVDGERYGASDFEVEVISHNDDRRGFVASLLLAEHDLRATLEVAMADPGQLRMYLALANAGEAPISFKTAFPHLGGLALSNDPRDDYYMFPAWGGIIASANTQLRTAYGENTAWWQMIDVFSPGSRRRRRDALARRDGPLQVPGAAQGRHARAGLRDDRDRAVHGAGDVLGIVAGARRGHRDDLRVSAPDARPGEGFTLPPARSSRCIPATGMRRCRATRAGRTTVWQWRGQSSELARRWNIVATGWGPERRSTARTAGAPSTSRTGATCWR
jgi:hypothetical protein